jgi:hypothetical protein
MCCGQKRSALRSRAVPSTMAVPQAKTEVHQGRKVPPVGAPIQPVNLLYLQQSPIQLHGAATGRLYQFSRLHPVQSVDPRDAAAFLRTLLFRPAR